MGEVWGSQLRWAVDSFCSRCGYRQGKEGEAELPSPSLGLFYAGGTYFPHLPKEVSKVLRYGLYELGDQKSH